MIPHLSPVDSFCIVVSGLGGGGFSEEAAAIFDVVVVVVVDVAYFEVEGGGWTKLFTLREEEEAFVFVWGMRCVIALDAHHVKWYKLEACWMEWFLGAFCLSFSPALQSVCFLDRSCHVVYRDEPHGEERLWNAKDEILSEVKGTGGSSCSSSPPTFYFLGQAHTYTHTSLLRLSALFLLRLRWIYIHKNYSYCSGA